jgi:hypothetical protein
MRDNISTKVAMKLRARIVDNVLARYYDPPECVSNRNPAEFGGVSTVPLGYGRAELHR